jgi:arylsulfate sulfotransferase
MRVLSLIGLLILCVPSYAKMMVALTPSLNGPQRVGTAISWTAVVTGSQPGSIQFQFTGHKSNGHARLLRGFHKSNQFVWAPSEAEGDYSIEVTARNRNTRETAIGEARFHVNSNVAGMAPVIVPTQNPLVAMYSAPGCPSGSAMYVVFSVSTSTSSTDPQACTPNASMNFYIAGMLPSTTYTMNYVVMTPLSPGSSVLGTAGPPSSYGETYGPTSSFITGAIDPALSFPKLQQIRVPDERSSLAQGILLLDYLSPPAGPYYFPTAMDAHGRVVWYYPVLGVPAQDSTYFIRPIPNSQGHMLLIANDPDSTPDGGQILREIDLAGNTVVETNASVVTEQLAALGVLGITGFNHDAIRLPNGHILVLCSQERIYPAGTQGSATEVDILGDAIVDLDPSWNVAWSWSAYDHLDTNRAAVLGETCYGQAGCPQLVLATQANDWLHANSLDYLADSGNVLMSIRHQDWVIKIDYANGNGTGNVLWKLGVGGDFAILSSDPYPWFSHQHDAQLDPATGTFLAFDNGNTRVTSAGGVGNSRGYALQLDEVNLIAKPNLLADLGVYSIAVGSAQLLDNGNYHFHAGLVPTPSPHAYTYEVLPDGSQDSIWEELVQVYRSYRMSSMYSLD